MQYIRKVLNKSNGDYESTARWKYHSDRSDNKNIRKFIGHDW